jgi:DNA-binding transcriptional MerR regulator
MKDLCAETGLSRQAIHFYIQAGLLPEGTKTGKNMAWYGPEHVERLHLIRRLQEERLLPLRTIRALLAGDVDALPPVQRALLAEVSSHLPAEVAGAERGVPLDEAAARHGVPIDEVERMVELGLVAARGEGVDREIASDAARLLEVWGQFRAVGFTAERGWVVDDLLPFAEAIANVVEHETRLLFERMSYLDPRDVAPMIERALPLIHATLGFFHQAAVRAVFAQVAASRAPKE